MEDDASFGRWMEHRRRSLLLTREQLSLCAACSAATIRKIEADERRPSKAVAERLAGCLNVDHAERPAFLRFARGEAASQRPSPVPVTGSIWQPECGQVVTNLPAATTRLIGREYERHAITELLQSPHVRLVTLTGVGGTGKTRLALQVAADVLATFQDGVWFVNLAPISDPQLVISTIGATLGVSEVSGQPLLATLKNYLKEKHVLLVLDNVEQVVAAAMEISELLAVAPGLKVLVTSRIPLHLYAEHEYPVPPLQLPDPNRLPPLEQLIQYEAVRFFIQRAQTVKPDFQVTNANAPAVALICVRLDGLPLTLELAAARTKVLPPEALLQRLTSRLKLLTGGARDLPARQQTLRATIDWSYSLLNPNEQQLFVRLAVFVGGRTLEAIEAVCNAEDDLEIDPFDGVTSLLNKSMLRRDEGPGAEPRFVMLETIHEYASERLDASGEADILRHHHALFYLTLVERVEPELVGPQQITLLSRLEAELDNLRTALRWLLKQDDIESVGRLVAALYHFWRVHNHFREARQWCETVLARKDQLSAPLEERILDTALMVASLQGDYVQVSQWAEESLARYQALGYSTGIMKRLNDLAGCRVEVNDLAGARAFVEQSLTLARANNSEYVAAILSNLGFLELMEGNLEQATSVLLEALTTVRQMGDMQLIAITLNHLGWLAVDQGNIQQAQAYYAESLPIMQQLGHKLMLVEWVEGYAGVMLHRGRAEDAVRVCAIAAMERAALGVPGSAFECRRLETFKRMAQEQLDEATFAAAYATGEAMSLDEAVACALGE